MKQIFNGTIAFLYIATIFVLLAITIIMFNTTKTKIKNTDNIVVQCKFEDGYTKCRML